MGETRKVVINACFGGFSLSDAAYEKLIEWGVPVRKYVEQVRDPVTGLYNKPPENEGEVIFDRELTPPGEDKMNDMMYHDHKGRPSRVFGQRYWDSWIGTHNRHDTRLVRLVEELGAAANGGFAKLEIVEIPADVEYEIQEYDGNEHVAEAHRTWR
jgi:hypothetical protein